MLLWWAVAWVWLAGAAHAGDKVLDATPIDQLPVSLTEYFAVLEDPSTQLTLADVLRPDAMARFQGDQAPAPALNYGFTPNAYWLRLNLRNTSDHAVERLLEISYVRLGNVQLYQLDQDRVVYTVTTGFLQPYATRPYKNRFPVFPLTLKAHADQVVLLRVQTSAPTQIPARLWAPQAFHDREISDYLGQAWYFGVATAMILFNLLLFVALRDSIYVLYVCFVAFFAFGTIAESGLGNQFLWLDAPRWAEPSGFALYSLSVLFFLPFMRRMLNTPVTMPMVDRFLRFLWVCYLCLLIGLLFSYPMFIKPFNLVTLVGNVTVIGVGIRGSMKRLRSAYFILAAFAALVLASFVNILRNLGVVAMAIPASSLVQAGSAIEMLVLAFALADRYNTLRLDKAKAQALALQAQAETLKAQAETVQAQSEKVTALMQLVTNVSHEVNTPIGAVKASGKNIADALDHALIALPALLRLLDAPERALFTQLVNSAGKHTEPLTTREERAIKNGVRQQLEAAGVADADDKARVLVKLQAQSAALDYLPLLQHAECDFILETASGVGTIVNSASTINTAVDRVAKIVTTLKSFSQADRSSGVMRDVDVQAGIETVLAIYANHIKQGTELVRSFETLPRLQGWPDELIEAWTHLIHNALQAMAYHGTLTIGLRRIGDEAVVLVSDSGSGIADDIHERIFEPFFTTRPPGEGAGLGLAIVKKIVDKHKGRIDVRTEVGVGSTFTVYLPLQPAHGSIN